MHRREPGRVHGAAISATSRASATRRRDVLEPERAERHARATTATPARRRRRARRGRAPARIRCVARRRDQCHVGGRLQPGDRDVLEPERDQRHRLQRRQRLHADRHLPDGAVRRREPGRRARRAISATSAGVCDPATGAARTRTRPTAPPAATATPARRPTPARRACARANPLVCTASDQCHVAGMCDPATGMCSNPNAANGTACNDANACTTRTPAKAGRAPAAPRSSPICGHRSAAQADHAGAGRQPVVRLDRGDSGRRRGRAHRARERRGHDLLDQRRAADSPAAGRRHRDRGGRQLVVHGPVPENVGDALPSIGTISRRGCSSFPIWSAHRAGRSCSGRTATCGRAAIPRRHRLRLVLVDARDVARGLDDAAGAGDGPRRQRLAGRLERQRRVPAGSGGPQLRATRSSPSSR